MTQQNVYLSYLVTIKRITQQKVDPVNLSKLLAANNIVSFCKSFKTWLSGLKIVSILKCNRFM